MWSPVVWSGRCPRILLESPDIWQNSLRTAVRSLVDSRNPDILIVAAAAIHIAVGQSTAAVAGYETGAVDD